MISILLFLVSGVFNAIQDTLEHHLGGSVFDVREDHWLHKWTNEFSWMNAYENWNLKIKKKWFFGLLPKPAFTVNLWHLSKSLMLVSFFLGLGFASMPDNLTLVELLIGHLPYWVKVLIIAFTGRLFFGLGFWTFYNYVLIKK